MIGGISTGQVSETSFLIPYKGRFNKKVWFLVFWSTHHGKSTEQLNSASS